MRPWLPAISGTLGLFSVPQKEQQRVSVSAMAWFSIKVKVAQRHVRQGGWLQQPFQPLPLTGLAPPGLQLVAQVRQDFFEGGAHGWENGFAEQQMKAQRRLDRRADLSGLQLEQAGFQLGIEGAGPDVAEPPLLQRGGAFRMLQRLFGEAPRLSAPALGGGLPAASRVFSAKSGLMVIRMCRAWREAGRTNCSRWLK